MNGQEPLDFSYQLTSSARDSSPDPYDQIPSLERDYCSNFSCCGLHLSDLHSLLDHFEEYHVLVVDDSGYPVFPCTTGWDGFNNFQNPKSQSHFPVYPYTSVAFDYPQINPYPFDVPHHYQFRSSSPLVVASPMPSTSYPQHTFLDDEVIEDIDITATFDALFSDSDVSSCSPTPEQLSGLPPSSFAEAPSPRKPISTCERRQRKSCKPKILGPKTRPFPRKRARAHKCPTVGCSKSYLNPNGLKYHIEKGTCRMESD